MKKFVSFLLLAAMLLSMSVVAMAEESFSLVSIQEVPESFTQVTPFTGNRMNDVTVQEVVANNGMSYNEDYCFLLELQANYSSAVNRGAFFTVSTGNNVKVLVGSYIIANGQTILALKNGSGANAWPSNPFVGTASHYFWYSSLKNDKASDKTLKLFIAVDPKTVTEDTNLTVYSVAGNMDVNPIVFDETPLATWSTTLDAYTPEQTNTQISTTNGQTTTDFPTLEAAVAAASTTTETSFTVPAGTTIAGFSVPADNEVKVTSSETSGNVTVKETSITAPNVSQKVYVIGSGDKTAAISSDKMSTNFGNYNSSTAADISDNINVAQVLSGAVSEGLDISSMTSMELSLAKDTEPSLSAIENSADYVSNIGDKTIAVKAEVHPIVKITTGTGDQKTTITRPVSNEELKENVKFRVSVPGLSSTKTYTIYHFGTDGTLKETFTEQTPDNLGMVYVDLSSFSYLLAVENGYADPASTEVIFTYLQGNFGNTYEFTMQLKVPDSSYVPSLNLGGFRALSPSNAASYAASDVVAYTVASGEYQGAYYYEFHVKIFAKFLNTPIYVTVVHDNAAVAVSPIVSDNGTFMNTSGDMYGYSMADYVGIVNLTDSSYDNLYQQIGDYANAVLMKFPDNS